MIVFKQTSIGYQNALIGVHELSLPSKKMYALIGRNGSGKSTLLKTIIGQIPAISGDISIYGSSVQELFKSHQKRSEKVAFVSSMFMGVDMLTLNEYVGLGRIPQLGHLGRMQKEDHHIVQEVLEKLKIIDLQGHYTSQLSDGERQLASLARAMVQDTPLLVLDEPTSFLDVFNKSLLLEQLEDWVSHKDGRTVIFSSHDLENCIEKEIPTLVLANRGLQLIEKPTKLQVMELLKEENNQF